MKLVDREPAMMTNRSSHMPTLMKSEITKSAFRLRRTRGAKRASGMMQLHVTIVQKSGA